ncbi:MAG: hypothetical protein U0517_01565, partial [Candidatus Andersenbacteria bacterium]
RACKPGYDTPMRIRATLLAVIVVSAIFAGLLLWVLRPKTVVAPREFATTSTVVFEDAQDYPDKPASLQATHLRVIRPDTSEAADFTVGQAARSRPVVLTRHHLYYFDSAQGAIVDATRANPQPLEGTQVDDPRFGGYLAVAASPDDQVYERLAYGLTERSGAEFTLRLLVLTRRGETVDSRIVWEQTSKEAQVVVPLAWASDGETIFFGTRLAEEVQHPRFGSLLQLRVPADGETPADNTVVLADIKASSVAFPGEAAELVGLSRDSNLALFVEADPAQATDAADTTPRESRLLLLNLASGRTQTVPVAPGGLVGSVAFGEQNAVVTVAEGGAEHLELLQFGLDQSTRFAVEGTATQVCGVQGSNAIIGVLDHSSARGTWRITLNGGAGAAAPKKLSQFACVTSGSVGS